MTVIELMIGIAIVGILLAAGVPSFGQWLQNSQVRTVAESIQNGLQLARAEAVRRNTLVSFSLAGSAWTVGCATPVADTDGDGSADCPATIQSKPAAEGGTNASVATSEVVAATGAAAVAPAFSGTVTFTGIGRVVTAPGSTFYSLVAGDNAVFTVSNPSGGTCASVGGPMRCLQIVVATGGQVRMCDPALAATDPRGC